MRFYELAEALTPDNEFLSKAERVKKGDLILWKSRIVGTATGEVQDDRVFFIPNDTIAKVPSVASLPIDQISLRSAMSESADDLSVLHNALRDFLPFVMQELELTQLPKINLSHTLDSHGQPSFGGFVPDSKSISLAVNGRHPVDICRTLAHELVHFKQNENNQLNPDSGETGSDEENEANSMAGIIMRKFSKQFPDYINNQQ
jgi:hypothetical protein